MFLKENVYKIDTTAGAYAYVVRNEHGITMIDAFIAGNEEAIMAELKAVDLDKIDRILLTHADYDHVGCAAGIQELTGCDVFISAREMETVDNPSLRRTTDGGLIPFVDPNQDCAMPNVKVFEGDSIAGFTIIPAYGHTWGHTAFLHDGVLFLGDLLAEGEGRWQPFSELYTRDPKQSAEDIAYISSSFEFELACPAHGQPLVCSVLDNTG